MRVIGSRLYHNAIRGAEAEIGDDRIRLVDQGNTHDKPEVNIGVNWSACGTQDPQGAESFAGRLSHAAYLAENFPYNGCRIDYSHPERDEEMEDFRT